MIFKELNLSQRIAKNTTYAIIGNVIFRLINFFIVLSLARYLGKELFGYYGFIFAYLAIFEEIIQFGLIHILVREISRDRTKAALFLGNALILRFFIVLLCMIISWLIAFLLNYSINIRLLIFIASFSLFIGVRTIFEVIFRVDLKMQYPALESIIRASSYGLLILLAVYLKLSLHTVIIFNILSGIMGLVFLVSFSWKSLRPKLQFNPKIAAYLLKQSSPLMLSSIFLILYYRIDVIMLSKMKTFVDIGYYTASTRLVESLGIFPVTLINSIFPIISEAFKANKEVFQKICRKVFVIIFAIVLPSCILTSLFSTQVISFLYGNEFLPSYPALRILVWSNCFIFIMFLSTYMLIAIEKQAVNTVISLLMVITNVILNLLLIPRFSFVGSSIAVLISAGMGCFLAWGYLFRVINFRLPILEINKLIFLNLIFLLLSLIIFNATTINWVAYSLVYSAIYCLLLYRIKILPMGFSFK